MISGDNRSEMTQDNSHHDTECQLQVAFVPGEQLAIGDKIRNKALRFFSAFRRRMPRNKAASTLLSAPGPGICESQEGQNDSAADSGVAKRALFKDGELVRILPLEKIKKTLDSKGRCEGLQFMMGMAKFCGREVRILKRVRMMFDERLWKMVRIKNAYLLDGVICDGRDVFDGEGCDRSCFFFWKDLWLERIDGRDSQSR